MDKYSGLLSVLRAVQAGIVAKTVDDARNVQDQNQDDTEGATSLVMQSAGCTQPERPFSDADTEGKATIISGEDMQPTKLFLSYRLLEQYYSPEKLARRITLDALEWGLGDLPPLEESQDYWQDITNGRNVFHRISRQRPITSYRLIPANGYFPRDKKTADFFLVVPSQCIFPALKTDQKIIINWLTAINWRTIRKIISEKTQEIFLQIPAMIKEILPREYSKLSSDARIIKKISIKSDSELFYSDDLIRALSIKPSPHDMMFELAGRDEGYVFLYGNDERAFAGVPEQDGSELICKKQEFDSSPIGSNFNDKVNHFIREQKYVVWQVSLTFDDLADTDISSPGFLPLLEADSLRLRLRAISATEAKDRSRGLWDAWWPEGVEREEEGYVQVNPDGCIARDPWRDVQQGGVVCIDFGTSSTVAAVRESDNSVRLLRLNAQADGMPEKVMMPYENPTALEFADLKAALAPWRNEPWRPLVMWKHVKCSHLARNELRQGQRSESGIQAIKTWARAVPGTFPVWLRDEAGADFALSPLPVEDTAEGAEPGDVAGRDLDPIELYAYFLGIACNNQAFFGGRIYCNYTMTFPVKFPREVRQRILQGFRRGLVRSMPLSLGCSRRWREESPFRLMERASEPTAFAASVLPWLGIEPTKEGVSFAVFDFGGGTTDFAFGLWRLPTPEERMENPWEQVLDILDVTGDENLGGEHLLELLAFELLRGDPANCAKCIEAGVSFILPSGETLFDGSELLFTASHVARANSMTLCELLRPLWEEGTLPDDGTGMMEANFLNHEERITPLSLAVDKEALLACLQKCILSGVRAFFAAFAQAFKAHGIIPQQLHVLLAGNSCRSPQVMEAFETCLDEIVPNQRDSVIIHKEMLPGGEKDVSHSQIQTDNEGYMADGSIPPTLKTGVALGLLRLLPGESTGMVERNRAEESPFLHTVGTFSNNILQPVLQRNAEYGQWQMVGKIYREGVFLLGYTLSPLALEQQCPRRDCRQLRLEWGGENFGKYLFIKAVSPGQIAAALGDSEAGDPDEATLRTFTLEG